MEFILLSLLLLAGLFTFSIGSDDPGTGDPDPDEDDVLTGAGDETVSGGAGNDLLTLEDDSTGFGGAGNDTLNASDNATAYGRKGDDSLTGTGNAVVMGGDGNDFVVSSDGTGSGHGGDGNDTLEGYASTAYGGGGDDQMFGENATLNGGAGNDTIEGIFQSLVNGGEGVDFIAVKAGATGYGNEGDDVLSARDEPGDEYEGSPPAASHAYGGAGNDRLTVGGQSEIEGGEGDDLLIKDGDSNGMLTAVATGGAGHDRFVLTNLVDTQEEALSAGTQVLAITDFDPAQDTLGVVYDPALIDGLTVTSTYNPATDTTSVEIVQYYNGDPQALTVGRFDLKGVDHFDAGNLQFYADGNLVPIAFSLEGTEGNDVLTSGHPAGTGTGMGYGGDDEIDAGIGGARGGSGNDTLSDRPHSGGGDLYGETGDDHLSGSGDLFGGAGNDVISLGASVVSFSAFWPDYVLDGTAVGGSGDDTIWAGAPTQDGDHGVTVDIGDHLHVDAGAGNDVIHYSHGLSVDAGSGNDIVFKGTDWETAPGHSPTLTLGNGSDQFYLEPDSGNANVGAHIVDFNPSQDALGIVAPAADMTNVTMTVTFDAATNATTITFDTGADDAGDTFSFTLDGVNGVANPIAIRFFANEAAALAGTSYATF